MITIAIFNFCRDTHGAGAMAAVCTPDCREDGNGVNSTIFKLGVLKSGSGGLGGPLSETGDRVSRSGLVPGFTLFIRNHSH
jgi:hypothetical protein